MNFIYEHVLDAIEKERPALAGWCEDKRHEQAGGGKLEALRWIVFSLDRQNKEIAARALGIQYSDLEPLGRILHVI